ncbi:rab GTPase-activating protein 1-like isoform X1 [Fundulus heteroclitus]|uniref:rab GTPase-activating protein 1-like isoform X1 n=1 Tax=Fundulus heteroclitus TaxID=8078 RepID=UPI00165C92C9|nr:rab GTPase-activating protein 1-like isoform X1 [Fundulus heteroclitus]XP_036006678.1 rab GTPase-activating protein 1-like isoform X1 [Fundulus heteroclitus]
MMQEVSMVTAYDAHAIDQMSEEEILACLVAETGPTFNVPTKKVKLGESRLQIMDDDPLDKYLKENRRLQQASLRLEQENDSLAHRLITSKVALRNALDKAEDRVDELTKNLLQTQHRLKASEEEKRSKEEEAAMLKEVFRRELERAEQEIKKSSGIISDYKQICSQLTSRLERQEAAHREELDALKSTLAACSQCRHVAEAITAGRSSETAAPTEGKEATEQGRQESSETPPRADWIREDQEKESLSAQIRELEKELVQTKLQVVEANCKIQELEHQKGVLASDVQQAKNNWISKALTSLRTSTAGHHGAGMHREGPPTLNWNLHSSSLTGWPPKKLSWPHKDNSKNA